MPKKYDQDLRDKVIAYLEAGHTVNAASKIFNLAANTIRNCYKQRAWGEIGHKIIGMVTGKHMRRANIIAGLCSQEIVAPMIFQGSCNTQLFIAWIKQQLVPLLKKGQAVVMDNASFHKSSKIKEAIEQAGCRLIYLLPYSPDLNPIETFWANMKKWIKHHIPHITNTWNAIQQFFNTHNKT